MKIPGHVIISLAGSGILYRYTDSFSASLWFLISGVFMDADHYIDYLRERGMSLNLKKVYLACENAHKDFKKLFLIFHSYELLMIMWLAVFFFKLDLVWASVTLSLTLHLISDQITNPVSPLGYFLLFRAANNFAAKKIFTQRR